MKDAKAVKRYRERRDERLRVRADAGEDIKWITVHGAHIPLDEEGNMTGPVAEKIKSGSKGKAKGGMSVQKANSSIKSLLMDEHNYGRVELEERLKKWADDLPAGATISWGKQGNKATKLDDGTFELHDKKGKLREVPDYTKFSGLKPADSEFVMEWVANNVEQDLWSEDWEDVGVKVTLKGK